MKTFLFFSFLLALPFLSNAQVVGYSILRKYIDISNSALINNTQSKSGWIFNSVASDEFNNQPNEIKYPTNAPYYPNTNDDFWKVLNGKWACRWSNLSRPMDPYYDKVENINVSDTCIVTLSDPSNKYVAFAVKFESSGFQPQDTNMYPVKKYYSIAEILSSELKYKIDSVTTVTVNPGHLFKYGYFEIRCKLPKAKYAWPAFWLFNGPGGHSDYNEIDAFELGANDAMVFTSHWQPHGSPSYTSYGKFVYALPGQTYSNDWITVGVKWEFNKIVWYVNNKVVRIVRDIDIYTPEDDTTQHIPVMIPDHEMFLTAGNGMNIEWMRYNMMNEPEYPNNLFIDYIRAYQRQATPELTVATPDPVFSINGIPSSDTLREIYSSKILLNASESYMPGHLYNIIIKSQNGTILKNVTLKDDSTYNGFHVDMSNLDLHHIYNGFANGMIFEIVVRGNTGTVEKSQMIRLGSTSAFQPSFSINGIRNEINSTTVIIPYNSGKPSIILDATNAREIYGCNRVNIMYWDGTGGMNAYKNIIVFLTDNFIDLGVALRDTGIYVDNTNGADYTVSLPDWFDAPVLHFQIIIPPGIRTVD